MQRFFFAVGLGAAILAGCNSSSSSPNIVVPTASPSPSPSPTFSPPNNPSGFAFDQQLPQSQAIVQQLFGTNALYEADAQAPPTGGSAPTDVTQLRFVYQLPNSKTAFVDYFRNAFLQATFVNDAFLQDDVIPTPLNTTLVQAIASAQAAGYTQKFTYITLRKPLEAGISPEPYYIFNFIGVPNFIYVGVNSRNVTVGPLK